MPRNTDDAKDQPFALFVVLFAAVACSHDTENAAPCQSSAIMFGTEEPTSLLLSAGQQLAVVSVVYSGGDGCTGTFVTRGAIATSSHCILEGRTPHIVIGTSLDQVVAHLRPVDVAVHPDVDLGLLYVDEGQIPAELVPVPVFADGVDERWVDSIVEIGGFGITEDGSAFVKRFAATLMNGVGAPRGTRHSGASRSHVTSAMVWALTGVAMVSCWSLVARAAWRRPSVCVAVMLVGSICPVGSLVAWPLSREWHGRLRTRRISSGGDAA